MAQKTVSQAVQEQSQIELLPERNGVCLNSETISEKKWYSQVWIWLIILALFGVIYWWFMLR